MSKDGKKADPDAVATASAVNLGKQPDMMTFGSTDNSGLLAQQLQAGGLLGAVGNPKSFYQPVASPILDNPGELHKWMLSQGMSFLDNTGKDTPVPGKPGSKPGVKPVVTTGGQPVTTDKKPDFTKPRGIDR
jgi:hypothetical protein